MPKDYSLYTDEKLACLAQADDREAEETLIRRYIDVVKKKTHLYFIAGADREDVIQEGMIGLFKAIRDYSYDKDASFGTFAHLCINRQILTAVKMAARLKHEPLNSSISLSTPIEEEGGMLPADMIRDDIAAGPEEAFFAKELEAFINGRGEEVFSRLELEVLTQYLSGKKLGEIAQSMDKGYKSVENAMQRIKKKISSYIVA